MPLFSRQIFQIPLPVLNDAKFPSPISTINNINVKIPPPLPPGTYSNIVTLVFKTPKVLGTRANSTARWKIWGFVKISNTVSFDRKASIYDTT